MKDIPMFTTPYGVASLSLGEVPYRKRAYIRVLSTDACDALIDECVSFCRICGAEHIYAQGHPDLEHFTFYTAIWSMRCVTEQLIGNTAMLFPVLAENIEHWRKIYNERMADVPLAAYMTELEGKELCQSGEGYYIHRNGTLLGIGRISGDRILAIASVCRGCGADILSTLAELMDTPTVSLEVASENHAAVALYQKVGFLKTAEVAKWYCVFDAKGQ